MTSCFFYLDRAHKSCCTYKKGAATSKTLKTPPLQQTPKRRCSYLSSGKITWQLGSARISFSGPEN